MTAPRAPEGPQDARTPEDTSRVGSGGSEPAADDTALRERFEGHDGRECGEHRTTGHRAWCFDDSEWCYAAIPCRGCELPSLRKRVEQAEAEAKRLREHILDIDAHATPYEDLPDDPGYVGVYLLTSGALHRALGQVGHSAPKCGDATRVAELTEELEEAEAAVQRVRSALTKYRSLKHRDGDDLAELLDTLGAAPDRPEGT